MVYGVGMCSGLRVQGSVSGFSAQGSWFRVQNGF